MTMPHMRKLHLALGLEGACPSTVAKMVDKLVRNVLDNPSDEEVAECLHARSVDLTPPRSVLRAAENLEQVCDYFENDELKAAKGARVRQATRRSASKPVVASTSASSSSSTSLATSAQKQKPRPQWSPKEGAPVSVSDWLPAVPGVHLRWKGGYPTEEPPYSHCKTFPAGDPELAHSSFLAVLRWIWARHEAKTGQACPFALGP